MRTVRLTLGFQGTRYEGWQSQRNGKTLQELFERHLGKILKHKTSLVGCSRTDSGVHAKRYVAHLATANPIADRSLRDALNYYLPEDVVVYSARTAPRGFHARFDARLKHYRYTVWNSKIRPLFEAPFALWHPGRLNVPSMRRAARHLVGLRDFTSFCDQSGDRRDPRRTLKRVAVRRAGNEVRIDVVGSGFLRHMVRIVAGTLLEVGRGRLRPEEIPGILKARDRRRAGPTAKAHGLMLVGVRYGSGS